MQPRLHFSYERAANHEAIRRVAPPPKTKYVIYMGASSSKKCGCPFRLKDASNGYGQWSLVVICEKHNRYLGQARMGSSFIGSFMVTWVRDAYETSLNKLLGKK